MKKTAFILSIFALSLTMTGCMPDPETTAGKMIGDWETIHIDEDEWWWYYNEDGTEGNTNTYNDSYDIVPGSEDWGVLRIGTLAISIIEIGDEESEMLLNIPFTYSLKDDQLTSLIFSGDHTNTVTVSFKDDDTMVLYMKDVGYMEDNEGYEHYESWTTYRRVK